LGFGIWDLRFGIWDLGFEIWDLGFGIFDYFLFSFFNSPAHQLANSPTNNSPARQLANSPAYLTLQPSSFSPSMKASSLSPI
jgi:hypothetical protein